MAKENVPENPDADTVDDADLVNVMVAGLPDGPVTFSRPGVEQITVTVKGGKVSTSKANRDWLLANGVGTAPTE